MAAVAAKLKATGTIANNDGAMSARALASLMGVDDKTVVRWITTGGLEATRSGSGWRITRDAFREWVGTHPRSINLKRVDAEWFIDLLYSA